MFGIYNAGGHSDGDALCTSPQVSASAPRVFVFVKHCLRIQRAVYTVHDAFFTPLF